MTTTPDSKRRNRHILATVFAVVGVLGAGAAAFAANMSVLGGSTNNATSSNFTTNISPTTTAAAKVIDVYVPAAGAAGQASNAAPVAAAADTAGGQTYAVDTAGSVTVGTSKVGIYPADVVTSTGWVWSMAQTQAAAFTIEFTNGTRTLDFTAALNPDGSIAANVTDTTPAPAVPAASQPTGGSTNHEGEGSDD